MFNVGGGELLVIALAALIIFGPTRLPGFVRTAARWYREFLKLRENVDTTLSELREEIELKDDGGDSANSASVSKPRKAAELLRAPDTPAIGRGSDDADAADAPVDGPAAGDDGADSAADHGEAS